MAHTGQVEGRGAGDGTRAGDETGAKGGRRDGRGAQGKRAESGKGRRVNN